MTGSENCRWCHLPKENRHLVPIPADDSSALRTADELRAVRAILDDLPSDNQRKIVAGRYGYSVKDVRVSPNGNVDVDVCRRNVVALPH